MVFIPIHDANRLKHIDYHYATIGLIAANVAVFLLTQIDLGGETVLAFTLIPSTLTGYELRPDAIALLPEPATLLTYSFLHADIWHLGGNMVFLWVFGDNVEDAVGHARFLLFYALCAIGGGLAHVLVEPTSAAPLIGASGAVAGIVAAYLILHPRVKVWVLFFARIPIGCRHCGSSAAGWRCSCGTRWRRATRWWRGGRMSAASSPAAR